MNKDPIAVERFRQLHEQFKFKTIVETGTHEADGALFLSEFAPVRTIEIDRSFWEKSQHNLEKAGFSLRLLTEHFAVYVNRRRLIGLFLGDSEEVMRWMLLDICEPICFYLDAHWRERLPLLGELRAISEAGIRDCVIIVHDCLVPDRPFGFDTYHGQPISYEFMKDELTRINPNFTISYNREAAGNCRGILYATP